MQDTSIDPFPPADRLFINGDIHTLVPGNARARVLAVKDGRIVYAGDSRGQGARLLAPSAEVVDLGGRTVVPGLMDAHLHFLTQGQRLSEMDIYLKSKADILASVAREAEKAEPGRWILGRGWNNEVWEDTTWPSKEDLDAVAPRNPVMLSRADAHSLWVNSAALAASGITETSANPPGGEIWRNAGGGLAGILVDTAIYQVWAAIPPLTVEEKQKAWCLAQEELFACGITGVGDAWQYAEDHESLKSAYASGALRVRCNGMLGGTDKRGASMFDPEQKPVRRLFGCRLSLDMYKLVLDGSLGSRSAWLSRDYADRPGHRGEMRYTDAELLELITPPARQGFRICLHAIGDAAVEQALNAYAALARSCPQNAVGHRIEHFQMASPEQIGRTLALGVIPAMQTVHEAADKGVAQIRLDATSLRNSYPWRGVLDGGGIIANGSDSPMERLSPWLGIHAAVTRTPFACCEAKLKSLRMSRMEALMSYTVWAAAAQGEEGFKGALGPGMLADFVVLDRDIFTCPEEDIAATRVLMTVLGGESVYTASA